MSYRSAIDNRNVIQTFSSNTHTIGTTNSSPASVGYVDSQTTQINANIAAIEGSIAILNGQIASIQSQISTLSEEIVRPIGGIIISPSSVPPPYTILCNGATLLIADYPELFAIIGYAYGGSVGLDFNIPNFINYFPLGGNGNLNGVASSNLISGNGTIGANNTQYISASVYGLIPGSLQYPIQQVVPPHSHTIGDNGHLHLMADVGSISFGIETTEFLTASQINPIQSDLAYTGIQIQNTGSGIQFTDPISGLTGVNITPPFIAMNFYIITN